MSHIRSSFDITVLFVNFTSARIIPETLRHKLPTLGLSPLCNRTLDFLNNRATELQGPQPIQNPSLANPADIRLPSNSPQLLILPESLRHHK